MKRVSWVALSLVLTLLLTACGVFAQADLPLEKTGVSTNAATREAAGSIPGDLERIYQPEYAKGFHIEYYYGGARIIETKIEATMYTPALSQRILVLPADAVEPVNTTWQYKLDGYANRVVTLSSSHAGHFANLSAVDCVKGTSIKADSCYIPELKTALENGATKYVGAGEKADKELIVSLQPQVTFVGGMPSDIELAQKLEESGVFCFYFGDFAEMDYLGRAQWIELIGAFIGKDQESQDYIRESAKSIDNIIARTESIQTHPKVLWFVHSSSVPNWKLRTSLDYVNSIVTAVGGELYCPADSKDNSVSLSNEDFLTYLNGADKIIHGISLISYPEAKDITYFNKEGQIDFATAKAFKNDDCYVVGYDWAQDTADAAGIIQSMAICLYPEVFKDFENSGKIMKFKVN